MRALATLLLVGLGATASACATVAPYEREYLARRGVDTANERPEDAFRTHVYSTREGALGGSGSSGGGCGCN